LQISLDLKVPMLLAVLVVTDNDFQIVGDVLRRCARGPYRSSMFDDRRVLGGGKGKGVTIYRTVEA